jgi:hypothetical protein
MPINPYQSPKNPSNLPTPPENSRSVRLRWLIGLGGLVIFIALLLPNYRGPGPRRAARRMLCSNRLKQIGLALQNYHDEFRSLPPAYIADEDGKPIHSWRVLILPYMEQQELYKKYSFSEPWNGPNNSKLHHEFVDVFTCPSRSSRQSRTDTSYVAVKGSQTAWPGENTINYDNITDGASNTILVVEMVKSGIHWMEPRDLDFDQMPIAVNPQQGQGISSEHPSVALVVFADGHTAALMKDTPPETLRRLLTIADGKPVRDY